MAESPTRFFLQEVTTRVGAVALVTMDNGEEWQKPNVFGSAALGFPRRAALAARRAGSGAASSSRASRSSSPPVPT